MIDLNFLLLLWVTQVLRKIWIFECKPMEFRVISISKPQQGFLGLLSQNIVTNYSQLWWHLYRYIDCYVSILIENFAGIIFVNVIWNYDEVRLFSIKPLQFKMKKQYIKTWKNLSWTLISVIEYSSCFQIKEELNIKCQLCRHIYRFIDCCNRSFLLFSEHRGTEY